MRAKKRLDVKWKEKFARILFVGMTLLMSGINQGMEGAKKDEFALLKAFYGEKNEFMMLKNLQQYFDDNFRGQVDLIYMENLLRGTVLQSNKIQIPQGEEYKLWALPIPPEVHNMNRQSPFFKVRKQFTSWATMMREYVEMELGMPKAGSAEEQPYLFKKGWFDVSEDPTNPLPYFNDHDFYLSDFVTQEVWVEVMGENPSLFPNKIDCPQDRKVITKFHPGKDGALEKKEIPYCEGWAVTNISLYDAQKFVHIMNMGSLAHVKYDIPTEWQFDLAARGGIVSETEDKITNTGRFGSLEVTDLETFKTKIPWTGDFDKGPGRTKQKSPFPRPLGPYDLIGHLFTWTKTPWAQGGPAARLTSYTTKEAKNWGLDWNLEKRGLSASNRVARGLCCGADGGHLRVGAGYFCDSYGSGRMLGLRLLRTSHKPLNP